METMTKTTFNADGMTILHITHQDRPEIVREVAKTMNNEDVLIVGCTMFFDTIQGLHKAIVCYYPA